VITVNGHEVATKNSLLRDYQIPANKSIVIRAENKEANTYDEVTVNLDIDGRRSIRLNPKKASRQPSNYPNQ
jgi:hypothetical protein